MSKKEEIGWYSCYQVSPSGKRATRVTEPCIDTNWLRCYTEKEAFENFQDGLEDHVRTIIYRIKLYGSNKALRKRLEQYNRTEALKTLDQIEYLIKGLPKY